MTSGPFGYCFNSKKNFFVIQIYLILVVYLLTSPFCPGAIINGKFLSFYPASTDEEAKQTQLDLSRDQIFGMPGYVWADFQQQQNLPVYVYRFTRIVPAEGEYKKYKAFRQAVLTGRNQIDICQNCSEGGKVFAD